MTDRTDEDPAVAPMFASAMLDAHEQRAAGRMREACGRLAAARGPTFRLGGDGELKAGSLSISLHSIPAPLGSPATAPQTTLMSVMPRRELHSIRHTLALQLNPHALVVHGAALATVPDGTLVLVQPIELMLYDDDALAAALGRFVDLALLMQDELGLGMEGRA